jgi:hypothetical protein
VRQRDGPTKATKATTTTRRGDGNGGNNNGNISSDIQSGEYHVNGLLGARIGIAGKDTAILTF